MNFHGLDNTWLPKYQMISSTFTKQILTPPQIPVQNEMKLQILGYFLPQHRENRIKNNSQTRHLLKEWLDTMWVGHLWVVPEKKHELVSTTKDLNRLGNFLELSVFPSTDDQLTIAQFTKGMLRFLNVQTSWYCIQKMYNRYSQLVSSYGGWKIISLEGTTFRNSRFTSLCFYYCDPLPWYPLNIPTSRWSQAIAQLQRRSLKPQTDGHGWHKRIDFRMMLTFTRSHKKIQMANHQLLIWYSRQYKHLASPSAIIWYIIMMCVVPSDQNWGCLCFILYFQSSS